MLHKFIVLFLSIVIFTGCGYKQPFLTRSATIVFKTPTIKYHDKCFIERYEDNVKLTILDVGVVVTDMTIYQDKICKNFILCFDANSFNERFLDKSYERDFLYNLFTKEDIYFKDKEKSILIKVIYDKEEKIENNATK
ncbi:MAG: hypothetical protein PHF17_07390 [Arcobacteraceae bacterium]|jgi:hypothetical protein|nr:hypothetical protein [Arcobacteraceae bacterium]